MHLDHTGWCGTGAAAKWVLCKGKEMLVKRMLLCWSLHIHSLAIALKIYIYIFLLILLWLFWPFFNVFSLITTCHEQHVSFHTQIPLLFSSVLLAVIFDLLCCFYIQASQ